MSNNPDIEKGPQATGSTSIAPGSTTGAPGHAIDARPLPADVKTKIGDPIPLGFFSFASTAFILSLYNIQTRAITHTNVVVGMALFCGGVAMLLAGMWAFPRGDTLIATVLVSYGVFWLSYAVILIPGVGILGAYALESEFRSALGIYLVIWGLLSLFLFIGALLDKSFITSGFLASLMITFWVWAGGIFLASIGTIKAAGVLGCIAAMIAYFLAIYRLSVASKLAAGSLWDIT